MNQVKVDKDFSIRPHNLFAKYMFAKNERERDLYHSYIVLIIFRWPDTLG